MPYYVEFQSSVRFDHIKSAAATIIAAAYTIAQRTQQNLLVTAGTDAHVPPSRHCLGEALDFRVNNLPSVAIVELKQEFTHELGPLFYVSLEAPALTGDPVLDPHLTVNTKATAIHLHTQPVKGSTYPPPLPSTTVRA